MSHPSRRPRGVLLLAGLVVCTSFLTACGPASAQSPREIADAFAERMSFDGVIFVASSDSVVVAQAYGLADYESDVPTRLDTRYQLGSISKWISSLVVLSLVDEGTLALESPIGTYLSGLPEDTGRRVTLHHLLTHTSGVPNDFLRSFEADPSVLDRPLPVAEAVRQFASGDLLFEPGSDYDYSHSNWILVQAVVERATGRPFADVLEGVITAPLGLDYTSAFTGDFTTVSHAAVGYDSVAPVERNTTTLPAYAICMGGLYSTVADLLTLVTAVHDGDLLSTSSRSRLTTVVVENEGYAYGGRMHTIDLGGRVEDTVWLTGSNGPFKSRLSRVLKDGTTVITLSNTGTRPEETEAFTEHVLAALKGQGHNSPSRRAVLFNRSGLGSAKGRRVAERIE